MSRYLPPVRDLPDPPRRSLSWEDVRVLREAGSYETAKIAEEYLRADEQRKRRWRWLRWWAR